MTGSEHRTSSVTLSLIADDIRDIYWQGTLQGLLSVFRQYNVTAVPEFTTAHPPPGTKSGDITTITSIVIPLSFAAIPVISAAIKHFAEIRRVRRFKLKTKHAEIEFTAMGTRPALVRRFTVALPPLCLSVSRKASSASCLL